MNAMGPICPVRTHLVIRGSGNWDTWLDDGLTVALDGHDASNPANDYHFRGAVLDMQFASMLCRGANDPRPCAPRQGQLIPPRLNPKTKRIVSLCHKGERTLMLLTFFHGAPCLSA
jgi:hypothetical protein